MVRNSPTAGPVRAPAGYGFPADPGAFLAWSRAEDTLRQARTYWLGTVTPSGRPYATPLWGVWVDGALYFDGMPTTRWARNFAANPEIDIHLEVDGLAVMLDGRVEDLETDAGLGERIVRAWHDKYGRAAPEPVDRGLFRLRPRTVRAWTEALSDATRWVLQEGGGGA